MTKFNEKLAYGLAAEEEFANVLEARRFTVIRINKHTDDSAPGGPRLTIDGEEYAAPDMLIYKSSICRLVEVKRTGTCVYYESEFAWRLGINYEQYLKYCAFDDNSRLKIMLGYCVDGGFNDKYKLVSPSGKFCQDFSVLRQHVGNDKVNSINPRLATDAKDSERMIFWNVDLFDNLYKWKS